MTCLPGLHKQSVTLRTPATTSLDALGNAMPATFTDSTKLVIVFDRDTVSTNTQNGITKEGELFLQVEYADFPDEARTYPLTYYGWTVNNQIYRTVGARKCYFTAQTTYWKLNVERCAALIPASGYSYSTSPVYSQLVNLYSYLVANWTTYGIFTGPYGQTEQGTTKPIFAIRPTSTQPRDYAGQWQAASDRRTQYEVTCRIGLRERETATQAFRLIHSLQEYLQRQGTRDALNTTYDLQIAEVRVVSEPSLGTGEHGTWTGELEVRFTCAGDVFTVPSAPRSFTATADSTHIDLAWLAPSSTGGSAITIYNIYRGTTTGVLTLLGTSATLAYGDSAVVAGITYYYAVSATNAIGEGTKSSEASVVACAFLAEDLYDYYCDFN